MGIQPTKTKYAKTLLIVVATNKTSLYSEGRGRHKTPVLQTGGWGGDQVDTTGCLSCQQDDLQAHIHRRRPLPSKIQREVCIFSKGYPKEKTVSIDIQIRASIQNTRTFQSCRKLQKNRQGFQNSIHPFHFSTTINYKVITDIKNNFKYYYGGKLTKKKGQ